VSKNIISSWSNSKIFILADTLYFRTQCDVISSDVAIILYPSYAFGPKVPPPPPPCDVKIFISQKIKSFLKSFGVKLSSKIDEKMIRDIQPSPTLCHFCDTVAKPPYPHRVSCIIWMAPKHANSRLGRSWKLSCKGPAYIYKLKI